MKRVFSNKWLTLTLVGVLFVAGYEWGIMPLVRYNNRLNVKLSLLEKDISELFVLKEQYQELVNEIEVQGKQSNPRAFNLLSYIQEASDSLGVKSYIKSMRPTQRDIDEMHREETVSMELSKVPLNEFVSSLYLLETALDTVWIVQATCHPDAQEGMDIDLTVSAIVDKEPTQSQRRSEKTSLRRAMSTQQ